MVSRLVSRISGLFQRFRLGVLALTTVWRARRNPELRPLISEIDQLRDALPARYEAQALPEFLAELAPTHSDLLNVNPDQLRDLIDAKARLDRRSPFGLCLRRSLWRYHFLRRAGVELGIVFGVRFRQAHEGEGVAGHAWNTLGGQPYHEREEDYRGFTVVYRWPKIEK